LKSSQRAVIIFNEKGGKNILLIYAPLYKKGVKKGRLKSSQRAVIIFNEKGGKNILLIYAPLYIKWDEIEVI
jgi:hypothetical protein